MSEANSLKASALLYAKRKSGRSFIDLGREILRLRKVPNSLSILDYVKLRVFDAELSERKNFLGTKQTWSIIRACGNRHFEGLLEDKFFCEKILKTANYPHIKTLAIIDFTGRSYFDCELINNCEQLGRWLENAELPIFAKRNWGIQSIGSFRIDKFVDGVVELSDGNKYSVQELVDEFLPSDSALLLQEVEQNASALKDISSNLATLRIALIRLDGELQTCGVLLKLPIGKNIADNFWRNGNLICEIDESTGEILQTRTLDTHATKNVERHPQNNSILAGRRIPGTEDSIKLVKSVANIFYMFDYISFDVALTEDGPKVVEINPGGSYEMIQLATGRGFLTPSVRRLLKEKNVPGF